MTSPLKKILLNFKICFFFRSEGVSGLFRGYTTTVIRDLPFSLLQMPLWEYLKKTWAQKQNKDKVTPLESAFCGSIAGGFSAVVTTPLDVAKTRIMLAESGSDLAKKESALYALKVVHSENGIKGLFAGITPRVAWISIGGALFLGIYDLCVSVLS